MQQAWSEWPWQGAESDGLRVRLATEADIPAILDMWTHASTLAAVGETPESARASFRRLWYEEPQTSGLRHFVVEDAGRREAIGYLRLEYPFQEPGCLWLTFFVVAPSMRSKGFGRRIMELLRAEAKASGCVSEFGLHTLASDTPAIRLYESVGFRCIRREAWRCPDGSASDRLTLLMRRVG